MASTTRMTGEEGGKVTRSAGETGKGKGKPALRGGKPVVSRPDPLSRGKVTRSAGETGKGKPALRGDKPVVSRPDPLSRKGKPSLRGGKPVVSRPDPIGGGKVTRSAGETGKGKQPSIGRGRQAKINFAKKGNGGGATTKAVGEEGGNKVTRAVGESGKGKPPLRRDKPVVSRPDPMGGNKVTRAVGESGKGKPPLRGGKPTDTTQAMGEEGGYKGPSKPKPPLRGGKPIVNKDRPRTSKPKITNTSPMEAGRK